eukprot:10334300-Lingulodinium_polyedra.AAC.1
MSLKACGLVAKVLTESLPHFMRASSNGQYVVPEFDSHALRGYVAQALQAEGQSPLQRFTTPLQMAFA